MKCAIDRIHFLRNIHIIIIITIIIITISIIFYYYYHLNTAFLVCLPFDQNTF